MLRGGAWCASVGVFLIIVAVCAWVAYRLGRISLARARFPTWIDLKDPHEEYYDYIDTTTPFIITKSEVTPEAIAEHFDTTPKFIYVKPKVTPPKIADAPRYTDAPVVHRPLMFEIPYSSRLSDPK